MSQSIPSSPLGSTRSNALIFGATSWICACAVVHHTTVPISRSIVSQSSHPCQSSPLGHLAPFAHAGILNVNS